MKEKFLFITEDTFNFKKGEIIKNFSQLKEGVLTEKKEFISNKNFIVLEEKLSSDDEKRVKEIINQQLRILLWNLYTKQNILVK